ncbi:MAG: NUDIX hydrolase [Steroidobacter sp.]
MNSPADADTAPTPRHAATVMLLREAASSAEVLVIRRHENLAFMGGMWVFPGGALSVADTSPDSLARIPEASQLRCAQFTDLHGKPLARHECLGLAVAAYRETFEETGVLLATTVNGRHSTDDLLVRVQEQRRAIASDAALFAKLLHQEHLLLDVDRLTYWAHWITPSNAPRRFDTRFFIVLCPPEQTAAIDTIEAVEHAWMTPAELIAAAQENAMPVSHPTLYNLMELDTNLRECGSLDALLLQAGERRIVPVLPKVIREGATTMVLPWDAEYPVLPGAQAPAGLQYPTALRALPSRMIFTR